jgi:diguanylate cyclase (GGDEF)-like protein
MHSAVPLATEDLDALPPPETGAPGASTRDGLTGLPDRAAFLERLPALVAASQDEAESIGLALVDLDWFGEVEQDHGRATAQALLRAVANRLRGAPDAIMVARTDHDEFAVVVPGATADATARAIVAAVREPFKRGDQTLRLSASCGSAVLPEDTLSALGLLRRAEAALFFAKNAGRDRAVRYDRSMRAEIARDVRASLGRGGFLQEAQPLVSLDAAPRVVAVEALTRWHHPTRGLLQSAGFKGLFDNPEVAILLGAAALESALGALRAWRAQGVACGRLIVNLSSAQLAWPDLGEQLSALVTREGLVAEDVVLDLPADCTAHVGASHPAETLAFLRRLGFGVAIDRASLDREAFGALPLDGLWVRVKAPPAEDTAAWSALVAAHGRLREAGAELIVERLERRDQLGRARMLAPLAGQGFVIARPMPPESLAAFVTGLGA